MRIIAHLCISVHMTTHVLSALINHSFHWVLMAVVKKITFHPFQATPLWKVQDQLSSIGELGS